MKYVSKSVYQWNSVRYFSIFPRSISFSCERQKQKQTQKQKVKQEHTDDKPLLRLVVANFWWIFNELKWNSCNSVDSIQLLLKCRHCWIEFVHRKCVSLNSLINPCSWLLNRFHAIQKEHILLPMYSWITFVHTHHHTTYIHIYIPTYISYLYIEYKTFYNNKPSNMYMNEYYYQCIWISMKTVIYFLIFILDLLLCVYFSWSSMFFLSIQFVTIL